MKTKLDRVPVGLHDMVGQESNRRGVPRTYVYKEMEDAFRVAGNIREMTVNVQAGKNAKPKPIFRF